MTGERRKRENKGRGVIFFYRKTRTISSKGGRERKERDQ